MKKYVVLLCFLPMAGKAQTVSFSYDAAGNRINREIVISRQMAPMASRKQPEYSEDIPLGKKIKIRQMSAEGIVRVEILSDGEPAKGAIAVYDMAGHLILTESFTNDAATADLSSYPTGIYLLNIEYGNNSYCWKITKK